MNGEQRRAKILSIISDESGPISATKLAGVFHVSRQIIVGDIALLRAMGHPITATARGYLIQQHAERYVRRVAVSHRKEETENELTLLVALGVHILDVTVEHDLYGELTGQLNIKSNEDIQRFILSLDEKSAQLLSSLTDGIHLHTLSCQSEASYKKALIVLEQAGYLYQND